MLNSYFPNEVMNKFKRIIGDNEKEKEINQQSLLEKFPFCSIQNINNGPLPQRKE